MNPSDTNRTPPHADQPLMSGVSLTRRTFLGALGVTGLGALAGCTSGDQGVTDFATGGSEKEYRQAAATYLGSSTMYKVPNCSCCLEYKKYLEATTEAEIEVVKVNDLAKTKEKYNVPRDVESCHTLDIGEYFVEGHVPREAIGKLALEKPDILGIALPGMPTGSPGMPGKKSEPFVIYAVEKDGSAREFMTI